MNEPLLSVILLALAASFMPIQFGMEMVYLDEDDGLKKSGGFISGITLFRVLVIILTGMLFPAILDQISRLFENISDWTASMLHGLKADLVSGEHFLFDVLMIVAGIVLWIEVVQRLRKRKQGKPSREKESDKAKENPKGLIGLILLGFTWTAVSINQWIFTTAAIGKILAISPARTIRFVVSILFILLASLIVLMPLLLYLIRPKSAQTNIAKVDNWFGGAMPTIVTGFIGAVGLYFILSGLTGWLNFLHS